MGTTLDGARLKQLTVSGTDLSAQLAESCLSARLSIANDSITEMGLTFQDSPDLKLFNSKLFAPGISLRYGDWFLTCDGLSLQTGATGPQVAINAPSKFVTALRGPKHTGAKSWGTTDLASWVVSVANSVGMASMVQPGLGSKTITRAAPEDGQAAETTWDVLTQQARESGVWLFEYGAMLVFAKPSFLVNATWPRRVWAVVWHDYFDKSEALQGMPVYKDNPGSELRESLTVKLISPDADQARPGDALTLSGRSAGAMAGTWIIKAVDFPMTIAAPVTVTCQRPIDPKVEPPRSESAPAASSSGKSAASSGGSAPAAPSGVGSAFDRFFAKYNGVAIDHDGAFGAQCVDLTMRYARELFGVSINGNGRDWISTGPRSGAFVAIGAGSTPQKGDIACWGPAMGGGYGHVAIVIANAGGAVDCMSQNPGPARRMTITKNGLQGYLRPKKAV